jgi:outer membrane protein assembly factor BamB
MFILLAAFSRANEQPLAGNILKTTGVKGGLVVHVGCGDGQLTAALRVNDSYLVHGLDTDAEQVAAARAHLRKLGVYGPVSVDRFSGRALPYIDNTVNLAVVSGPSSVDEDEIMRVLCPGGVAVELDPETRDAKPETFVRKPWPEEIDEWTHFMHDAGGNAVAHDTVVGPPRRLQWLGSPRWSRHHDHMSSVSACVSSAGRLFYIFDEAPRVSILTPPDWKLIARDAFNGTILWKRPIPEWFTHMMRLKSGPAMLPRRLVAVGDRVYVTLGIKAPLTSLDAATGETILTYKGTEETQELIVSDGTIFLIANEPAEEGTRTAMWNVDQRRLMAIETETGKVLWQKKLSISPMTLAADGEQVYVHDGDKIICLGCTDGKEMWTSPPLPRWMKPTSNFGAILVVHDGVVLFAGGERMVPHRGGEDTMTALSAEDGKVLWKAEHPPSGYQSPEDLLVADGLVWTGATTSGTYSGVFTGRDLKTGEVKVEFPPDVNTYWFHHRCYRGKATDNYLLMSRTGIEFIDFRKQQWQIHHWVRGACLYGIMPCNGLIYAPQHPCACYPEAKQYGFSALAPAIGTKDEGRRTKDEGRRTKERGRLEKGPAYDAPVNLKSEISNLKSDWPTFRGNAARSGWTTADVSRDLTPAWQTRVGGRLSSLVVADGKLLVAAVDEHTVHALDAETGEPAWSFTTGGRVDSPPTIYQGRAIFGSADGHVYCLRADDGELIWRFRAAPAEQRLVSFEQVESVWPVHGSVLVLDDRVYCMAGRSMFLDGGLRMLQLEPKTGRLIAETLHNDRDPETGEDLQTRLKVLNMPVALPDILSSDGRFVYMRSQPFDLMGNRIGVPHRPANNQIGEDMHLFAPTGFLDGSYWHRTYWVFGRGFDGGHSGYHVAGRHAPAGKILVHDDDTVYGFGRKAKYYRWTTPIEHHVFADVKGQPRRPARPKAAETASTTAGDKAGLPARRASASKPDAAGNQSGGPWVAVANAPSLNPTGKPLAVEAWVKSDTGSGVVVCRGGPQNGYAIALADGQPQFLVRADSKLSTAAAKEKVTGKWVHLAGVLTADATLHLYIDGKLAASAKGTGLLNSDPVQDMGIGADDESSVGDYAAPFALKGLVDEVRVYLGPVTDAEIAEHATTPGKAAAKDAKLVLCLTFDKDATDGSGHQNHGQAEGLKVGEGHFGNAVKLAAVPPKNRPRKRGGRATPAEFEHRWAEDVPMIVRAMALAGKTLFIVGPPDLVDEDTAGRGGDEIRAKLAEQNDAWYGKQGSLLWALSAEDGKTLAEYQVDALPVFDSMAAANGRLYFCTTDGKVRCYEGK